MYNHNYATLISTTTTALQYNTLHYTLRSTPLHYTSLNYTTLQLRLQLHYNNTTLQQH